MPTRLRPLLPDLWIAVSLGLAAGALAQIADGYQRLSEVGSRGGVWVAAVFAVGVFARSGPMAGIAAATFTAMSLVGYYVMGTLESGWAPPWATVFFWGVASITVVPALGWLSHWSWRSGHARAPLVIGLIAGGLLAEGVVIATADSAYRWYALGFDATAGVVIAAVGVRRTRRPASVALATVGGIAAGTLAIWIVEVLYRTAI